MNSIKCSRCGLRQIMSNGVCKQCNALLTEDFIPKDRKLNAKIIVGIIASVVVVIIISIAIPKFKNNASEETNLVSQFIPKKESELTGSIFIVTQGAENFKMGLVSVTVIPEEIITPYINSKKNSNEAIAKSAYEDAKQKATDSIITLDKAKDKYDSEVASLKSILRNDNATFAELLRGKERAGHLKWLEKDIKTAQINSENSLI